MPTAAENLEAALNGLTPEQIQAGLDEETPSDKENTDWFQYLKNQAGGGTGKTGSSFFSKYGVILLGAGIFIIVLMLFNVFGKK